MNKATWKAAHRFMRMTQSEKFQHPLSDLLNVLAGVAFDLRFVKADSLAYYEKFYTGKSTVRYLFLLDKYW